MPINFRTPTKPKRLSELNRFPSDSHSPIVDSPTTPRRTISYLRKLVSSTPINNMTRSKQSSTSTTGLLSGDSEDETFSIPDEELIKRATKSRSKTGQNQPKNQGQSSSDAERQPQTRNTANTRAAKDLTPLNDFSKLLNNQTKELVAKIDDNYRRLNDNQEELSRRLEKIEVTHEQRSNALERRLDAMESTLKRYEICESKVETMAELVDTRMKEIYEANKRFEGMFRDVAREIAIVKSNPNHKVAGEMEELRLMIDQVDQNSKNIHLVLTGLANLLVEWCSLSEINSRSIFSRVRWHLLLVSGFQNRVKP